MATAPLLTLTTLAPQNSVQIDGDSYFIRHDEMLSLRQSNIVARLSPRIGALSARADELTDDEYRELSVVLQQVCLEVLDAPREVQDRLSDLQRFNIYVAFTPLRSKLLPPPTGATPAAPTSTSANGSLGSSASMAAPRSRGTRKRRSG